jgi:hypothetical protein
MIVGSVLPITLRRQAEVKGAHRTAGPDHASGSSDPMFPKPLDARLSGSLRLERAKCITQPFPHTSTVVLKIAGFRTETNPDFIKIRRAPEGRSPERSEGECRIG